MKKDQLPSLLKAQSLNNNENSIFVEIGTWEGDFTVAILENTNCKKIYCIDPYKHFYNNEYPDAMNKLTQAEFDEVYNKTRKRLEKYGDRVEFIRKTSLEASYIFENESIDFVYIDGNHDFKYVDEDIRVWFPKVKSGGFLCGDDLYSRDLSKYDSDGNIVMVWSRDAMGNPSCWGKYGTYPACLKNEMLFNIRFLYEETQFSYKKI